MTKNLIKNSIVILATVHILFSCTTLKANLNSRCDISNSAKIWSDHHIQGFDLLTDSQKESVYYITEKFYTRLIQLNMYRPVYDKIYSETYYKKKYPYFVNLDQGFFIHILDENEKITDLEPYKKLKGKTAAEIFGYTGYGSDRLIDDFGGESTRQTLIIKKAKLVSSIVGQYNTFYHEFAHLLHLSVLTYDEIQLIETLYNQAMKNKLALDTYAEESSAEYFAQGFEAYFSVYKSDAFLNDPYRKHSRSDLKAKDPGLYEFIVKLEKTSSNFNCEFKI